MRNKKEDSRFNMKNHLSKCKRSQGQIITTVLLILIVIAVIAIVVVFIRSLIVGGLDQAELDNTCTNVQLRITAADVVDMGVCSYVTLPTVTPRETAELTNKQEKDCPLTYNNIPYDEWGKTGTSGNITIKREAGAGDLKVIKVAVGETVEIIDPALEELASKTITIVSMKSTDTIEVSAVLDDGTDEGYLCRVVLDSKVVSEV